MKWIPASIQPTKAGWYYTDIGLVEWGKIPFQEVDNEMYWLKNEFYGGHVTKWLNESESEEKKYTKESLQKAYQEGFDSGLYKQTEEDFETWYKNTYNK